MPRPKKREERTEEVGTAPTDGSATLQDEGDASRAAGAAESEATIYVRTTGKIKGIVAAAATTMGVSDKWVVERLIEEYDWLEEEEKKDLLSGRLSFDWIAELQSLSSWSNHLFTARHWGLAIQSYGKLEAACRKRLERQSRLKPKGDQKVAAVHESGLRLFCLYRIGFSWSEWGLDLRKRALKIAHERKGAEETRLDRINNYYSRAIQAAYKSISFHDKLTEADTGTALIRFNTACCCSILCTLKIEQNLPFGSNRPDIVSNLCKAVATESNEAEEEVWAEIGKQWRGSHGERTRSALVDTGKHFIDEINRYGEKAINSLNAMGDPPKDKDKKRAQLVPSPDKDYFLQRLNSDPDLRFLRTDKVFAGKLKGTPISEDDPATDEWLFSNFDNIIKAN